MLNINDTSCWEERERTAPLRRGNMKGEAFQSLHHSPVKQNVGFFTLTARCSQAVGWQTPLTNKQRNPLYIEIFTISVSLFFFFFGSISVQNLQFSFLLLGLQRIQTPAERIRHVLRFSECGSCSTVQHTHTFRSHAASSGCGFASNSLVWATGLLSGLVVQLLGVLKMQVTVSREYTLFCP